MHTQVIELWRRDSRTHEEKVFFRKEVPYLLSVNALKKKAMRLASKYDITRVTLTVDDVKWHRMFFKNSGFTVPDRYWRKDS